MRYIGKCAVVVFLTLQSSLLKASLRVYPVAVELSKGNQSSQLTVTHDYETERWVEISPLFFEMSPEGQMIAVDDEKAVTASRSAVRMLRFSPKRFLLKPGESQVVKLRSRVPGDREDGIYRVHLKFTPDEVQSPDANQNSTQISSQLSARISIAVPVYITKGKVETESSLSESRIVKTAEGWFLETHLNLAKGDMVRGNIFTYIVPADGSEKSKTKSEQEPLSRILGVATYTEKRKIRLSLGDKFDGLQKGQGLRVEFRSGDPLESQLIAEDTVVAM